MGRVSSYLRSNVLGLVAIFIALSGTAYAIDGPLAGTNQVGSADVINNEIYSGDVRDDTLLGGGLARADLRAGSVGSSELVNDQVFSADVRDDNLAGGGLTAADLRAGSVRSSEIAADSVDGARVIDNTLRGDDVDESTLTGVDAETLGGSGASQFQSRVRWAYVFSNGTLANGQGVGSVAKTGTGLYSVDFNVPVWDCAIMSSLSSAAGWGGINAGSGGVGDPTDTVYVDTWNEQGTARIDNHFYVALLC